MGVKVVKFGGTSLADASQILKARAIIEADPDRRYVVPSAPGKRTPADQKITDLLYLCHSHASQGLGFDELFGLIRTRYEQIVADLGLDLDLSPTFATIQKEIASGATADYAASRGEYLNGMVIAALLGYAFVDAAEVIHFTPAGRYDKQTTMSMLGARLRELERAVVPGFYGSTPDGKVKTFSRGGSDVTGAIVAAAVRADVYENWTDVSGLLATDPRIVQNPRPIARVTYKELRELAYMGASVLHDEAIFPVREAGIPVNIRNTNEPDAPGTMIVSEAEPNVERGAITGIAGRRDFTFITIEKALMNAEIGFGRRVLGVLEDHGVSFEHMPSGIDTMSLVIANHAIADKLDRVVDEIRRTCEPDAIEVIPDMAVIATVGRGMAYTPGMAARLFTALAQAGVNIRMIDQGSSELNIIVGVEAGDFETAVRAIYGAFMS